jgi:hypothetical protein
MKTYGLLYPKGNGNVTEVVVFADDKTPTYADFPFLVGLLNDKSMVEYMKTNMPKIVRCYPIAAEYVATEYHPA